MVVQTPFHSIFIVTTNFVPKFIETLITEKNIWPKCELKHGKPRHSESQGSFENLNKYVRRKVDISMVQQKSTKWSVGTMFVQYVYNTSWSYAIKTTPYEALFKQKSNDFI